VGLPGAHSALLISLDAANQNIQPLAKWPERLSNIDDFSQIIKYAILKNEQVSILNVRESDNSHFDFFALPLFIPSGLSGIIILKVASCSPEHHAATFKLMQQSVQWLTLDKNSLDQNNDFYVSEIRLLASCIEQKSYRKALTALVSELTQSLSCDRVALGEYESKHSKVVALSNSAQFEVRSNFMKVIADAMDEAIEQDQLILFPNPQGTTIQRAHQELARKYGSGSLLTLPLIDGGTVFGAIILFRSEEKPFRSDAALFCQQAMSLITPFLALKKSNDLALPTIVFTRLKKWFESLLGFKHLKMKLVVTGLSALILASAMIKSEFQVTADAVLEGKMQRLVAAPIDGFLMSASVRAGDTVVKGEVMANLDDAELQLELSKLNGQLQKFRREYREALSISDLVKVRVISAQIDQAVAEMDLARQQLQKIALTAPFDSVVIEGDLSQMLGSPVKRGDMLFKIAPLEGYRIILKVDESLISYIEAGQTGRLALSSMPERTFTLTIRNITAIAKAENNKNIFRVEASLDNVPNLLRPGMEGIGKINAGSKSLLWIWTHATLDWLRLWVWSWSF
jgi:hypothetical protein